MTFTVDEAIKKLERQIQATEQQLAEDKAALIALKRMMVPGGKKSEVIPASDYKNRYIESNSLNVKFIDFDEIATEAAKKKRSITGWTQEALFHLPPHEEFTVAILEEIMLRLGAKLPTKSPRARIAMSLSTLIKKGLVKRIYTGSGSEPHRFIVTQKLMAMAKERS